VDRVRRTRLLAEDRQGDAGLHRSFADAGAWVETVSIERGIVDGPDGLVEKGTKTHSARRVSLDAGTADGSSPWFPDSVSRSCKRLCEKEGVPDVRFHDLRHFVAT